MKHFKGKQFQKDVIIVAVGYYLRYNLSYRDVQKYFMIVAFMCVHTTILPLGTRYGKALYQIWKKKNRQFFLFVENG